MGSISRGFRLAKASWGVVRQDHQLLVLPVVSFLCSLIVIAVFAAGAFGIGIPADGESVSPALYVLGFVLYVALSFVTIFFNAAIVGTAMKRLNGEDASIKERLKALQDLDVRSADELRKAYEGVDSILDVKQQARFRVFEEQMERRKFELLMRARQGNRQQGQAPRPRLQRQQK